eukprot:jgi/Botrbrau1/14716/Bobra.0108s0065.1
MDDERRPTRILQSFSYTQGQRDLLVSQRARRNMNYAHILRETRRADAAPHYTGSTWDLYGIHVGLIWEDPKQFPGECGMIM